MEGISGCFFKICLASCNSANNFANISRTNTATHNLTVHSVTLRIVQSFLASSSLPPGFWLQGVGKPACLYVDLYRLCDSRDVNGLYWFSFPLSRGVLLSQWCKHQAGWLCHFICQPVNALCKHSHRALGEVNTAVIKARFYRGNLQKEHGQSDTQSTYNTNTMCRFTQLQLISTIIQSLVKDTHSHIVAVLT